MAEAIVAEHWVRAASEAFAAKHPDTFYLLEYSKKPFCLLNRLSHCRLIFTTSIFFHRRALLMFTYLITNAKRLHARQPGGVEWNATPSAGTSARNNGRLVLKSLNSLLSGMTDYCTLDL